MERDRGGNCIDKMLGGVHVVMARTDSVKKGANRNRRYGRSPRTASLGTELGLGLDEVESEPIEVG